MNNSVNGFYPRVSIGFAKSTDVELIAFGRNIVTLMTGNTAYPTPTPALTAISAQLDTFETAVQVALNGGRIAIAARNAERAALLALLRQLASYVQGCCQDDLATLLTSGFQAIRAPSPVGVLPAPQILQIALTGISGQLAVRWGRLDNAANYTVQVASSPDGPWETQAPVTASRTLLERLTPLKTYWVRVCANGSAGPGGWTSVMSAIVL